MTLLTVVRDVCAAVGVDIPTSVFSNINNNRTMAEMLALANEMAQRIAYDTREWQILRQYATFTGDGVSEAFPLPVNFKRMLLTAQVWRSTSTLYPMEFIPGHDRYSQHQLAHYANPRGEWIISNNNMFIRPIMAAAIPAAPPKPAVPAVTATFWYLEKNSVALYTGGESDVFLSDNDTFRLDERLLKLGMIWQWKAQKGSPYAEDMSSYETALARVAGADTPAPIIVGRLPISATVRAAYPWPVPTP